MLGRSKISCILQQSDLKKLKLKYVTVLFFFIVFCQLINPIVSFFFKKKDIGDFCS